MKVNEIQKDKNNQSKYKNKVENNSCCFLINSQTKGNKHMIGLMSRYLQIGPSVPTLSVY